VQAVESARPVDAIRTLTQNTLRDVVNQALDDPAFREALRPPAPIH
jgi:UDP:flavonoid glycosyltransferase YjiC (YdhE family)